MLPPEPTWPLSPSQTYKNLSAKDLVPIAKQHLKGLFLYHEELGEALATANREGEEARRQERLRIWGYA